MPRSKKSRPRAKPFSVPSWYVKLTPDQRVLAAARIRQNVKLARKYLRGFEARDGYSTRDVRLLSAQKLRAIDRAAATLKASLAAPHADLIVPRTAKRARQSIQLHAPQMRPSAKMKRFIIPVIDAEKSRARIRKGQLEVTREFGGDLLHDRYFYLPRGLRSWKSVIKNTRQLIKSMPQGHYGILMSQHGLVRPSADRDVLLRELETWHAEYARVAGKEETPTAIVGFVWLGDTFRPAEALKERHQSQARTMTENLRRARRREIDRYRRRLRRE